MSYRLPDNCMDAVGKLKDRITSLERENAELRKVLREVMEGCQIKNAKVMQIPFCKPEALIKADCLLSNYDPDDHD